MKVAVIAACRSVLDLPSTAVVRADVALGNSIVVFAGVGLGLWLLIGLISLRPTSG